MYLGGGTAAQAGKIHFQATAKHWGQTGGQENNVSHESFWCAFHRRNVGKPPGELKHLHGCRPS
jgi:hypothetical protein